MESEVQGSSRRTSLESEVQVSSRRASISSVGLGMKLDTVTETDDDVEDMVSQYGWLSVCVCLYAYVCVEVSIKISRSQQNIVIVKFMLDSTTKKLYLIRLYLCHLF